MNPKVRDAEAEVQRRREALMATAREIQQRIQPKTLARDAWETAKVKGADLAEDAVDAVKARPVAAGGIVAAIAMFLAREPIKDAVVSAYDAMTAKKDKPATPRRKPAPRKPRKTVKTETTP